MHPRCYSFCLAAYALLAPASLSLTTNSFANELILVEAESFDGIGGWVVDQQFMDLMGSPYLLAHGLGEPVEHATTKVKIPKPGTYRVWVRTRDWVAPWNAPGAPGRFKLRVNDELLEATFGTENPEWHWQDGGLVSLGSETQITLEDLTGFEGRCDAILLSNELHFVPPDSGQQLIALRSKLLGWNHSPADGGEYDLVVIGGGVAGTCAAISAARYGLRVALIQDRPVLGGNASSEVRVWPEGHTNKLPYPRIGDVVAELIHDKGKSDGNAKDAHVYEDQRKLALAKAEENLTLMLEQRMNSASVNEGVVSSVIAQHTRSGKRTRVRGRWFVDATGDGVLGALVGADFEMTKIGHMGMSNLWNVGDIEKNEHQLQCECEDEDPLSLTFIQSTEPQPFPRCPWAINLTEKSFPGRNKQGKKPVELARLGGWNWESGFDKQPIKDAEWIRDLNLRAMYGAWDVIKNVDGQHPNHRLKWAAFIAGKRESRRLLGDVILSEDDFLNNIAYDDAAFPCTWRIDLHLPHPRFFKRTDQNAFISKDTNGAGYTYEGPYWAPYRCLYSRNINNLFMAGRDISVTHEGLGPVRVMRTCGMMGEVVGMAASLCKKHNCPPRDIYKLHLNELKELLKAGASTAATRN